MLSNILKTKSKINTYIKKQRDPLFFKSSTLDYNAEMIALDFETNNETIFVVLPSLFDAQKYYDILQAKLGEKVLFYPTDEILTSMMALGSPEFKSERLYTIKYLLDGHKGIVVMTQLGLTLKQLKPSDYLNGARTIKVNESYNIDDIVGFLVNSGYKRSYIVEMPGEFSLRGNILDIFTLNNKHPYRIDFFSDEVETIKQFDVVTQKSFVNLELVELSPMHELFYTKDMQTKAIEKIERHFSKFELSLKERKKLEEDIENLQTRSQLETLNYYIPFFNEEESTIIDFAESYRLYAIDAHKMLINLQQIDNDLKTYEQAMDGKSFLSVRMHKELKPLLNKATITIDNQGFHSKEAIDLNVKEIPSYKSNLKLFYHDYQSKNKETVYYIALEQTKYYELFVEFLHEHRISYETDLNVKSDLYVLNQKGIGSFFDYNANSVFLNDAALFNFKGSKAIKYRSVLNQTTKIRDASELTVGDFVVHYDYGIGRYMGLTTMDLSGHKRDYLLLVYANEEKLYVPVDQIEWVLKYSSHDGATPQLSKMGGKQWQKAKAQARMRIKELSDQLIRLYAMRQNAKGYPFSKDNELQKQFEFDFNYQTTKDQEKAIIDVKFDMESDKPMDRLICGDVGFGKTEVALRAAFKAVLDAKQVLYLVPTTILARQHYYTFKERFEKYGANVALLNRFVKPKKQKEILEKLAKGYIDVVIGTHRLLSTDVKFKDLGLMIVDEEQRFGVMDKEKIKELKVNVDALTLSATPIPRTLQMSLMGLKDLSMIETPPLNRYPVQTYVLEHEDALIKEAIMREISRGGQVFYLYNKVQGIEGKVERLKKLVPEAKINFAHGQMSRDALENVVSDFIDHEFDILVATTIIETGVDIPNTNTLIIEDADKLGLSQLYQIRGRVGRSDRIAYAYLFYDKRKDLNDEAQKRLSAIKDFTALGSGYKIALRDLAIRGAGDILGSEQSGFIDAVGIELYMKLLEEAMTGETFERDTTQADDVYADRHINENYIESDAVRIEVHKRISSLNKLSDVEDLKDELVDRFGKLDVSLIVYMYEKLFKKLSHKLGTKKVLRNQQKVTLVLKEEVSSNIDGLMLFEKCSKYKYPVKLGYLKGEISIEIDLKQSDGHWLYDMSQFIEYLISEKK